jgi:uncharacterized protein (TIRG00374 family)
MAKPVERIKKIAGILIRLGIGVGILVWLLSRIDPHALLNELRLAASHWPWLAAGLGVLLTALGLCLIRWKLVLEAMDLHLSWPRATAVFLIGHFFNSFMPGGTGGDLIKAYYTARETHHRKTEAVATIFIDRTTGLMALIVIVLLTILIRCRFFLSYRLTQWAAGIAGGICLAAGVGLILLFSKDLFREGTCWSRWRQKSRLAKPLDILARAYATFYTCRQKPGLIVRTVAISSVNHFLIISSAYCAARALEVNLPYIDFISLVPIISIAGSLPLTPGGLGVREGMSIHLFALLGIPQGKAFFIMDLPYLGMLFWGLCGGLIFIFYAASAKRNPDLDQDPPQSLPARDPT